MKNVDHLCGRGGFLCRGHLDSCQVRDQEDGFYVGDSDTGRCDPAVFVGDRLDRGICGPDHIHRREDSAVSDSFGSSDRGILALLFPGAADRGYQ